MNKEHIIRHIEDSAHHLLVSVHKEAEHTKTIRIILKKYVQTGRISANDEKALKLQLADTLKICGIVIPFVLIPGASIVMPILIKVAKKHDIDLMPSVV